MQYAANIATTLSLPDSAGQGLLRTLYSYCLSTYSYYGYYYRYYRSC